MKSTKRQMVGGSIARQKKQNLKEAGITTVEEHCDFHSKQNLQQAGITLVALVVTIIVLLILAGITLFFVIGDNGLIQRTQYAHEESRAAAVEEARDMWKADVDMDQILNTSKAKSTTQIVQELVDKKLLTDDEKDIILGNAEKGIPEHGEITIASRTIVFKATYTAKGEGNLSEGEGTEQSPYLIQSIEDLVTLSNNVNKNSQTYAGTWFKLMGNLDFNRRESYIDPDRTDFEDANEDEQVDTLINEMTTSKGFKSIGTYDNGFQGCIDGNNKIIANLYIKRNGDRKGLIGQCNGENVSIKNLQLDNINIQSEDDSSTILHTGGIVGNSEAQNLLIENCNVSGTIKNGQTDVGGALGYAGQGNVTLSNNTNNTNINSNENAGGMCGRITAGDNYTVTLNNNINNGKITTTNQLASGLVAEIRADLITVEGNKNKGEIEAGAGFTGGIVGQAFGKTKIEINNCNNEGVIIAECYNRNVAGIIGLCNASTIDVSNCINKAQIKSKGGSAGGIIGSANSANINFNNLINEGDVGIENNDLNNAPNFGGIVGIISSYYNNESVRIEQCHNIGNIYGLTAIGGIAGEMSGNSSGLINKCYNEGKIQGVQKEGSSINQIGGIVGNGNSTVMYCYNNNSISGEDGNYIGGITGQNSGAVVYCYNTGNIRGKLWVGGLAGKGQTVTSAYNTGVVYVGGDHGGGIAGEMNQGGSNYNLGKIELINGNESDSVGALFGSVTGSYQGSYLASTFTIGLPNAPYSEPGPITRVETRDEICNSVRNSFKNEPWVLKEGDELPTLNI